MQSLAVMMTEWPIGASVAMQKYGRLMVQRLRHRGWLTIDDVLYREIRATVECHRSSEVGTRGRGHYYLRYHFYYAIYALSCVRLLWLFVSYGEPNQHQSVEHWFRQSDPWQGSIVSNNTGHVRGFMRHHLNLLYLFAIGMPVFAVALHYYIYYRQDPVIWAHLYELCVHNRAQLTKLKSVDHTLLEVGGLMRAPVVQTLKMMRTINTLWAGGGARAGGKGHRRAVVTPKTDNNQSKHCSKTTSFLIPLTLVVRTRCFLMLAIAQLVIKLFYLTGIYILLPVSLYSLVVNRFDSVWSSLYALATIGLSLTGGWVLAQSGMFAIFIITILSYVSWWQFDQMNLRLVSALQQKQQHPPNGPSGRLGTSKSKGQVKSELSLALQRHRECHTQVTQLVLRANSCIFSRLVFFAIVCNFLHNVYTIVLLWFDGAHISTSIVATCVTLLVFLLGGPIFAVLTLLRTNRRLLSSARLVHQALLRLSTTTASDSVTSTISLEHWKSMAYFELLHRTCKPLGCEAGLLGTLTSQSLLRFCISYAIYILFYSALFI